MKINFNWKKQIDKLPDELLDRILLAINLTRKDVYILNILKYGFFENRKHLVEDMNEYVKFLKKKIEVIKPNAIVALGKTVAQTLLNNKDNEDEENNNRDFSFIFCH